MNHSRVWKVKEDEKFKLRMEIRMPYAYNSKLQSATRYQQIFGLLNICRFLITIMDYTVLMFTAKSIKTNAVETDNEKMLWKKERNSFLN